ncbi:MAG TPA: hypothetical protein VGB77_04665 [Abditibacteriaceae bacterium]|jgi:hypothetical protein
MRNSYVVFAKPGLMRLQSGHAPLLFEGAALLGRAMYLMKLGRVRRMRWRGQIVWRKRRHFYAPLIVRVGNALSRWLNCGVYGLSQEEWLVWEMTLAPLCGDGQTRRCGRHLLSRPMPGASLRELLPQKKIDEALRAALIELQRLHKMQVTFPCGTFALWSHGDAHAGNVFYDDGSKRAQWFDFESVHDLRRPSAQRHADDLQTLLFSAAVYLPERNWAQMIGLAREVYVDSEVWREMDNNLRCLEKFPDIVHLGHVHLDREAHAKFLTLLKPACA